MMCCADCSFRNGIVPGWAEKYADHDGGRCDDCHYTAPTLYDMGRLNADERDDARAG